MRAVTGVVLAGLLVALGGLVFLGIGGGETPDGKLTERWISDTARNNTFNHHAVGVGRDGDVIVAPVTTIASDNSQLSSTSCSLNRLAPTDGGVRWQTTTPPEECFMHALTEPAIDDVDGDGTVEVVAATTRNATIAYSAADGSEEFRVPLSTYGYAKPTIDNVTAAPGPEIVTSDIDGHVVVAGGDGEVYWTRSLNATVWAAPAVGDVDADGRQEVVVGTNEFTIALNADGSLAWKADTAGEDLDTAQVDEDDTTEVFVASGTGVTALDGTDGDVKWTHEVRGGASLSSYAVGEAGDVGPTRVYFSEPGNVVGALDAASGEQAWSTRLGPKENTVTPAPVVGDLTDDGTAELVTVRNDGTVTVLSTDSGSQLAVYQRDVPVWTFPTIVDVTEDAGAEIFVIYGDGRIASLDYTEE